MSKVALVTDTHFGVHSNNEIFLQSQLRFFRDEFVPYLKENGIKDIVHLGDLFDNRNHINLKILNAVYDLFANELSDFNIHVIVGNHDSLYKNTIEVNSTKFLGNFKNVNVVDDIELINIDGRDILLVPWLVDLEDFATRVANKNTDCDVCMGHFEIVGFKFNNSYTCDFGLKNELFFNNFKVTFSGHFHTRSEIERKGSKVQYIGNPYHLSRHDIGDDRGFCVFDTETLEYEFVDNKTCLRYVKLVYPEEFTVSDIKGNLVDIYIQESKDLDENSVEDYISNVEKFGPAFPIKPKIIGEKGTKIEQDIEIQDTMKMIREYVEGLDIENSEQVYSRIEELYKECKLDV